MPPTRKSPYRLLVEGVDNLHSVIHLHTWLAWQERPGIPFGTALEAQVFRHDTEDALRFISWFNRLFVDV